MGKEFFNFEIELKIRSKPFNSFFVHYEPKWFFFEKQIKNYKIKKQFSAFESISLTISALNPNSLQNLFPYLLIIIPPSPLNASGAKILNLLLVSFGSINPVG